MTIKIGILGYGNLGRGVECAISQNQDTELRAVFTRRDPENISIKTEGVPVLSISDAEKMKDEIDVLILCGGSATDLPVQTPQFVSMFNVIDSFDTHARIPEHFAAVDSAAKASGKVGVIPVDGIRACSLSIVYTQNVSCQTAAITLFGGKESVRDIPMQSAESKASSTPDNIRFP